MRCVSAAIVAMAPCMPPSVSASQIAAFIGPPSGSPLIVMKPERACAIGS
jgi:hypothetical protein